MRTELRGMRMILLLLLRHYRIAASATAADANTAGDHGVRVQVLMVLWTGMHAVLGMLLELRTVHHVLVMWLMMMLLVLVMLLFVRTAEQAIVIEEEHKTHN